MSVPVDDEATFPIDLDDDDGDDGDDGQGGGEPPETDAWAAAAAARDLPGKIAEFVIALGAYMVLGAAFPPTLMFRQTLATGGDMGSHHYVAKAAEKFFPWSLAGWASGWYAGLPMLQFYFPIPYLLIWALSGLLGYDVAFKLVTVLGIFTLPLAAWATFKLMDAPRFVCALAPAGAIAFLFIEGRAAGTGPFGLSIAETNSLDIFGGFITSTMAGEFAYSIGLSLSLLGVGLLYRTMRRCTGRWGEARQIGPVKLPGWIDGLPWGWIALTALVLGVNAMTHLLPMVFIGAASCVVWLGLRLRTIGQRLLALAVAGGLAICVAATFLIPSYVYHQFTAGGRWVNSYGWVWVFPPWFWWILVPALLAIPLAVWRERWGALVLAWCALVSVTAFELAPTGQVVNGRFLPIWYLCCCLLAAWFGGEVFEAIPVQGDWRPAWAVFVIGYGAALAATTLVPSAKISPFLSGGNWEQHNYKGYEAQAAWPDLQNLMRVIRDLPPGRTAWEYNGDYSRFGTPRALENIPFFTGKDTMEGLLVESSPSARYHFWLQGEFSPAATGAVPGFPLPTFNATSAVQHLQLFGVKYFIAETQSVKDGFAAVPGVTPVTSTSLFTIYEIPDSSLVRIPANEPVRMSPAAMQAKDWRDLSYEWIQDPLAQRFPVTFGAVGTANADTVRGTPLESMPMIESIAQLDTMTPTPVPGAGIVAAKSEGDTLTFETSAIGKPHLVAVSYFPAWHATGAKGPYLVTPSLMLVYPTQNKVTLSYAPTPVTTASKLLSLLGLATVAGLGWIGWRRRGAAGGDDDAVGDPDAADGDGGASDEAPPGDAADPAEEADAADAPQPDAATPV